MAKTTKNFYVYAVDPDGRFRRVGPEDGYTDEALARGVACACGANPQTDCQFIIISASRIVDLYTGKGLVRKSGQATLDLGACLEMDCRESTPLRRAA